jgi:tRNA threonylcarbamoyladenosine biosynthesis protein TsaB
VGVKNPFIPNIHAYTMKILALDTTDPIGSVAAMLDGNLLLELELDAQKRSAQSLPPGMKNLLERVGWKPSEIELIALTIGPGSFTGLRVGVAMAKTFAYAVMAEILSVNTLDAIAESAPADFSALTAVIDAQRGDVVARSYIRNPEGWPVPTGEQKLISIDCWMQELSPGMAVTGPILAKITSLLPDHVTIIDQKYWRPRAAMVAQLANRHYAAGRRDNLWTIAPRYSRQSAAEEKWLARAQGKTDGEKGQT